jgi:hypothetical protein
VLTTANSSADIIDFNVATTSTTKQSFEAFKEAWQLEVAANHDLSAGDLRVALAIAAHVNRQSGVAWPGFGRLQRILRVGRSTVIRAVKRLERADHLSVKHHRNGTKNSPNEYQLKLKGSVIAMTPPPPHPSVKDDTTLVSQLRHPPSVTAMTPEPLNEPLNEPPNKKEREARSNSNPIIQIEGVAEEDKAGTLTTIAKPSLVSNRALVPAGTAQVPSTDAGLRDACFGWARDYAPAKLKMVQRILDQDGYTPIQVYEAIRDYGADFVNYLWANPKERRRMDHDNPIVSQRKCAEWTERIDRCWGTPEEQRQRRDELDEKIRRYHERERSK